MSLCRWENIYFIFHSPRSAAADGAARTTTLIASLLLFNLLPSNEKQPCQWLLTSSKYQAWASGDKRENQQRRINLWERLEDYFHLKLVKINVYIYRVCVQTVSIIQDSMQLLDEAGGGCVEPSVNICSVLNRDTCSRCVSENVFSLEVARVLKDRRRRPFAVTAMSNGETQCTWVLHKGC